jgi:hypothetical protein
MDKVKKKGEEEDYITEITSENSSCARALCTFSVPADCLNLISQSDTSTASTVTQQLLLLECS